MRWLMRTRRDEEGAVIVLMVASVLVIVGMAALVIDVGAILDEKRQLQNGADAGALAVAQSCARGACDTTLADGMADANSRDGDSTALVTYPTANKVTVATSTGGVDHVLPYFFGQALTGVRGRDDISSTATATWSGIAKARTLPLVISHCEWNTATAGGMNYNTTFTGTPSVLVFQDGNPGGGGTPASGGGPVISDCAAPSGQDSDGDSRLPGGFGWVQSTGCTANFLAGGTMDLKHGNSVATGCTEAIWDALVGTTILLPVFDDILEDADAYHIKGFIALRLTGYSFPSMSEGPSCPAGSTCVIGYITRTVTPAGAIGAPDLGATSVSLVN